MAASLLSPGLSRFRVVHVVASIDDAAAGPSYSVPSLARTQAINCDDVYIRTLSGWRSTATSFNESGKNFGCPVIRHTLAANWCGRTLAHSPDMRRAIFHDAAEVDIIHVHGLWLMPNIYPGWASSRPNARSKFLLAPRGMLGEAALDFSRWKKRAFWYLFQRQALSQMDCLHATSDSELEDIRRCGIKLPVVVAPNGIGLSHPMVGVAPSRVGRSILYLGRIHPKKGLTQLIEAWSLVEPKFWDCRLRIVGPCEGGFAAELRRTVQRYGLRRVSIEDSLFGDDKKRAFQEADVFILPSLNENFALTVAEALASGLPVISTYGAPWSGLNENQCGWWVEQGSGSIAEAMDQALSLPSHKLREMGQRGREWMARDFSWDRVAKDIREVYEWLYGRRDKPSIVHLY